MELKWTDTDPVRVRADSDEARCGFRYRDEDDVGWTYCVKMLPNKGNLIIKTVKDETEFNSLSKYVLIFNVSTNTAGFVDADEMVEPVFFNIKASGV